MEVARPSVAVAVVVRAQVELLQMQQQREALQCVANSYIWCVYVRTRVLQMTKVCPDLSIKLPLADPTRITWLLVLLLPKTRISKRGPLVHNARRLNNNATRCSLALSGGKR